MKAKSAKKRVKVKDLPKKEKKLGKDELKKVKGGLKAGPGGMAENTPNAKAGEDVLTY